VIGARQNRRFWTQSGPSGLLAGDKYCEVRKTREHLEREPVRSLGVKWTLRLCGRTSENDQGCVKTRTLRLAGAT
jgi:hypothetical protein